MAKTQRDLITRSLAIIGIIGAGETPDDTDYQDALDEYVSTHARLMADLRDKYKLTSAYWDKDRIPDELFARVSRILAKDLMSVFPNNNSVDPDADQALLDIVKIKARRKAAQPRFPDMPTTVKFRTAGINE